MIIEQTYQLTGCAIEATELRKSYQDGKIRAVDGVSFAVDRGRIFGLLGSNGAGKSTLLRMLTTLTRPDSGTARVAGFDVVRDQAAVRSAIGVVGQKHGSDPDGTGLENMMLQGHLHGLRGAALRNRVDELLERFDLASSARRVVSGYSGGMQRRLDIAMGLVHGPSVLFLDEPTTGLDPEIRVALWQEITRLNSEEKLTIVLTTHYLEEADRLADHLAIIDNGTIVATGSPDELKAGIRGDAISVELAEATITDRVVPALCSVPGLEDVVLTGTCAHARVRDGARAIPGVLNALERSGVQSLSVTVTRPSLDDVFLRITGQSLVRASSVSSTEEKS